MAKVAMSAATLLRARLEASLAHKIPSALSPQPKIIRECIPTGIRSLDELLQGGFPVGGITEVVGAECSGRTSLALSFIAGVTQAGKVCVWIDVSDSLHPESAAAAGVSLPSLLWVRCGVTSGETNAISKQAALSQLVPANPAEVPEKYFIPKPVKKGLHGGGFGPHPRGEVRGLSKAISGLFGSQESEPFQSDIGKQTTLDKKESNIPELSTRSTFPKAFESKKPWSRLDQALRAADLLLQNGGFAAIVLDMGDIAPAHALRVPLATWFRYRSVAAQKQTSVVLLLQHPCAKSSAALTLRLHPGNPQSQSTIFSGLDFFAEVERQRFSPESSNSSNIVPIRKPPQKQRCAIWHSRTVWTGR